MTAVRDHAPVLRTEDHHLITGSTRWTANIRPQGTLHLVFVRSPMPHARFTIDVAEARRARACRGLDRCGRSRAGARSCRASRTAPTWSSSPPTRCATSARRWRSSSRAPPPPQSTPPSSSTWTTTTCRRSPTPRRHWRDDAPLLHAGMSSNKASDDREGAGDVDAAIAAADVVLTRRFEQPRVFPAAMEPRSVVVAPEGDGFTAWVSTQTPHIVRHFLAKGDRNPRGPAAGHRSRRRAAASAASSSTPRRSSRCWPRAS